MVYIKVGSCIFNTHRNPQRIIGISNARHCWSLIFLHCIWQGLRCCGKLSAICHCQRKPGGSRLLLFNRYLTLPLFSGLRWTQHFRTVDTSRSFMQKNGAGPKWAKKTKNSLFSKNSPREIPENENPHSHIYIELIFSSGQMALLQVTPALEQRGVLKQLTMHF